MDKASPVEMRKALEAVEAMKKAGVLFVPIPVKDKDDHKALVHLMLNRLDEAE